MKQTSSQFLQRIQTDRNSVDHNEEIVLENIHRLKDVQLESQLKLLVGRERQLLHLILKHIQEADRRKLYAARAFSSLFEYLTKEMGYSSGAAQRRIEAARLMNQVPELALKIQKGDVNLSQIGIISQAVKMKESQMGKKLSAEVKREVIAEIAQKTTAQTQVLVAEKLDLPLQHPERQMMQKDQSCVISITLTPAQQMKLQRCRELLAAKLQQGHKASTTVNYLEELMDFYLNKKDPCSKNPRKDKSGSHLFAVEGSEVFATEVDFSALEMSSSTNTSPTQKSSKESRILFSPFSKMETVTDQTTFDMENLELQSVIENLDLNSFSKAEKVAIQPTCKIERKNQNPSKRQPSLKKQVFQKWDCCQFQDPLTKRTCGEKFQLEIEHLQPRWAGGLDHLENRTLLCRTHNQWKYRQQVGLH